MQAYPNLDPRRIQRRAILSLLLFFVIGYFSRAYTDSHPTHSRSDVLRLLRKSPSGEKLVQRAKKFWKIQTDGSLIAKLKWGRTSRTDAVLTRHYDVTTGKEVREREVTVVLRQNQPLVEVTLDLAHELIHATETPQWDPYDPHLSVSDYIWTSIEGKGGEVAAVVAECQVGYELASIDRKYRSSRCEKYRRIAETDERVYPDRAAIRKDFYRVGKWKNGLVTELGNETQRFPELSEQAPNLYSSTGQAPYPVALFSEYQSLTRVACQNTLKRLKQVGRAPASSRQKKSQKEFYRLRCTKTSKASTRKNPH